MYWYSHADNAMAPKSVEKIKLRPCSDRTLATQLCSEEKSIESRASSDRYARTRITVVRFELTARKKRLGKNGA